MRRAAGVRADGATADDVVETSVTTPDAGEVTITELLPCETVPGFQFLGGTVRISAPDVTAANPLTIVFQIDAAAIPPGQTHNTIFVFRNGVTVPPCIGAPQALPDPCVSNRAPIGGFDARITVLTSRASDWSFGVAQAGCSAQPLRDCRAPAVPRKATLAIKDSVDDSKDAISWSWLAGTTTTKAEFGDPLTEVGYDLCVYNDGALVSSTAIAAGGFCAGKPCWKESGSGYKFSDGKLTTPDGAASLVLKQGLVDGKAKILFKGKGTNLEMPNPQALGGPLEVQLRKTTGDVCWTATYGPPFTKHDAAQVKDKAD